jgi:hypothetical protein
MKIGGDMSVQGVSQNAGQGRVMENRQAGRGKAEESREHGQRGTERRRKDEWRNR